MFTNRQKEGTCENSMKNPLSFVYLGVSCSSHAFWSSADMFIGHPKTTAQSPNHHSQNITEYGENWQNLLP